MPATPLVSVVMPCFNQGRFIAEAIASVHAQSAGDVEIVVVEDCSTDGVTRDIVRALSCARTRTILHDVNRGVSAARNTGIRAARGVYVLPLDADDLIAPGFIAGTLALVESGRADVAYTRVRYFGTRDEECAVEPFSVRSMLRHNLVVNTALYRKSAWAEVGGYASAMQAGWEDWDFWLSLLEKGNRFARIEEPLFLYRQHGPSRSDSANEARHRLRETIFARHRELYRRHGLADARERPKTRVERRLKRLARLTKPVFGWDCAAGRPPAKQPIPLAGAAAGPGGLQASLAAAVLRRLTGRRVRAATAADPAALAADVPLETLLQAADIAAAAGGPIAVWGAGFASGPAATAPGVPTATRPIVLHAVRGRLSRERLRGMGLDVAGTAVGDPALLAGLLAAPAVPGRRFRLGIVVDRAHERQPAFTRAVAGVVARLPATRLLRADGAAEQFLARLRECDVVIAGCLPPLVAADALGIPNVRVRVPATADFPFDDYYSAFDVRPAALAVGDLADLSAADVTRIERSRPIDAAAVRSVVEGLLASCPLLVAGGAADEPAPARAA